MFFRFTLLCFFGFLSLDGVQASDWKCGQAFYLESRLRVGDSPFRNAHQSITHDLYRGEIFEIHPFAENGNQSELLWVKLRSHDPYTGDTRIREALFKPRVWGDGDGWSRTPMEYVAYALNLALGMDYVPPTAYRRDLYIENNGRVFTEGALIFYAPGFRPLAEFAYERFPFAHEAIISDNRVLNVLLQNKDAHYWNLGMARHWVDGRDRPIFIDFGASHRHGTQVTLHHFNAFGNSQPVDRIRPQTLAGLKNLGRSHLDPLVAGGFISHHERDKILRIRQGIIEYFERHPENRILD